MTPRQFEHENQERWQRLEEMLKNIQANKPVEDVSNLPTLFRQTCHDLSVAQHRMLGARLVEKLNNLAIDGYRVLERRMSGGWERLLQLLFYDFPRAVREEAALFWFSMLLFWGPFLFFLILTPFNQDWTMALLGSNGMRALEDMYGHDSSPLKELRTQFGSNFAMFAFYIWNNVGICLRTFGSGILGVGTIFVLLFNGAMIGASAAYVNYAGNPETFYSFVAGHSAPELLGIIISGMAGLRLGLSILRPGKYDRRTSLILGGRKAMLLITGGVFLTGIAAVIEGFWSATPTEPWVRYTVGALIWILTVGYLVFSGKERHAA